MAIQCLSASSQTVAFGTSATLRPTTELTFLLWYKWTGLGTAVVGNFYRDASSNNYGFGVIIVNNGNGAFYAQVSTGVAGVHYKYGSTLFTQGTWEMLGFTYKSSTDTILPYFNGTVQTGTESGTGGTIAYHANNQLDLFRFNNNGAMTYYPGIMGPMYLFNKVLTADEIMRLYRLRGGEGYMEGGVGKWDFLGAAASAASGTGVIRDRWGSNNGTPANSPTYQESPLKTRRG